MMEHWYTLRAPLAVLATLWGFSSVFTLPLRHRSRYPLRLFFSFLALGVMGAFSLLFHLNQGWQEVLVYCLSVVLIVLITCDLSPVQAIYGATWIILTHQLTMECWIIFYSFVSRVRDLGSWFIHIGLFFYAIVCWVLALTVCRWLPQNGVYRVGPRQFLSALALLVIFEINYCVLLFDADFPNDLVLLCALPPAQLYCVCTLYFQNALFRKSELRQEVELLNRLRREQQQQYDLAKENIAIINRKCHDLKHQMAAMRTMISPENQEKYLNEIERSVRIYDSILKTGNEVLDTVLTEKSLLCEAQGITIHCVADGSRLTFMDPVDLYTLFGNALDNAIEGVQGLTAQEKRIIDVLICVEKNCLVVQVVNPLTEELKFSGGLPVTTKGDHDYHGYGLKSIRHTVERYGGHMTVRAEKGLFSLKLLFPLEDT